MIKLIFVGKTKEKFLKERISEFLKRLRSYAKVTVLEIPDSDTEREGKKILALLGRIDYLTGKDDYLIAMAIGGKEFSSEEFADFIKGNYPARNISFVIGSQNGLSDKVLEKADKKISLSKMTFTHEMARLILIEQIYRAFTIIQGKSYHK